MFRFKLNDFFQSLFAVIVFISITLSVAHADDFGKAEASAQKTAKAVFAGGCFWCTESDFEKLDGVVEAVSGYIGGESSTANYKAVTKGNSGHYEASEVIYDPTKITYSELVEFFWRHIDPTDPRGQFCDKGSSYRSAIFYSNEDEKKIAEDSLANLEQNKPFSDAIVTPVLPANTFYEAEDYHQDYYKKNPIRYRFYRHSCGRDKRVEQLWGKSE